MHRHAFGVPLLTVCVQCHGQRSECRFGNQFTVSFYCISLETGIRFAPMRQFAFLVTVSFLSISLHINSRLPSMHQFGSRYTARPLLTVCVQCLGQQSECRFGNQFTVSFYCISLEADTQRAPLRRFAFQSSVSVLCSSLHADTRFAPF